MFNRFNGWQRIGVVLTALWLLFAFSIGAATLASLDEARGPFVLHFDAKTKTIPGESMRCPKPTPPRGSAKRVLTLEEATRERCAPGQEFLVSPDQTVLVAPAYNNFRFFRFVAFTLVPLFAFWLLSYLTIYVVRWVVAGFRRDVT